MNPTTDPTPVTPLVIRTSDRISFRECRRRWGWSSHLRHNLEPKSAASPLWLGTGVHYALEDFHGYKHFPTISAAFLEYVEACRRMPGDALPMDYRELVELGVGMLNYYVGWLEGRDPMTTLWVDGVPQVEVEARIPLPPIEGLPPLEYGVKLDRVCRAINGDLWVQDWKTAIRLETEHLDNDPQTAAYCWAGSVMYEEPIVGMCYTQLWKELPRPPRLLSSGKYSTSKSQITTLKMYRKAMIDLYVTPDRIPPGNVEVLNHLAELETPERDKFVQRDFKELSKHAIQAEGVKLLLEVPEMVDPDLPLYPNPTRMCTRYCAFYSPCLSMDDGGDWESEIREGYQQRQSEENSWRSQIRLPNQHQEVEESEPLKIL